MGDEDLLPSEYLAYYRELPLADEAADGRLLAESPLPRLAAHHYTTGGCYILAGAMASMTGLPIGVTTRFDEIPRHAFVVHGNDYIDAFGRQLLAELKQRDHVVEDLDIRQVADMLAAHPNGAKIRADLASNESKRYAVAAAGVVLAASGFAAPA